MLKIKYVGCEKKFDVSPENFSNYEIVFCPVRGLDHQVLKKISRITVRAVNCHFSKFNLTQFS